jgi:hypothetical protein
MIYFFLFLFKKPLCIGFKPQTKGVNPSLDLRGCGGFNVGECSQHLLTKGGEVKVLNSIVQHGDYDFELSQLSN